MPRMRAEERRITKGILIRRGSGCEADRPADGHGDGRIADRVVARLVFQGAFDGEGTAGSDVPGRGRNRDLLDDAKRLAVHELDFIERLEFFRLWKPGSVHLHGTVRLEHERD